jgi:quinol monooxygenase YgiN
MYGRITTYQVKPGKTAEMMTHLDDVKASVAKVAGLTQSYTVWRDDGHGATIALWESKAASEAAAAQIQQIWAGLGQYLAAPPKAEGYDNVEKLKG